MNDNLHLPPERDVPDPDAMFASIMAAADVPSPQEETGEFGAIDELALQRTKRRRLAPVAVAAAICLVAVGVGISHLMNGRDARPAQSQTAAPSVSTAAPSLPVSSAPPTTQASTPAPTRSTTAPPSTTPAPTRSTTSSSPTTTRSTTPTTTTTSASPKPVRVDFTGYGKATFKYVTIERLPAPSNQSASVEQEFVQGWYMRICVTGLPADRVDEGTLPIGSAAFRSQLEPNEQNLNRVDDGGLQPAYPGPGSAVALGECATGFVSFDFAPYVDADVTNHVLVYENSWHEVATWRLHK